VSSFVLADAKTNKWGRLRADLGHPEPYELHYVLVSDKNINVDLSTDILPVR
jgi:hypothetical protein